MSDGILFNILDDAHQDLGGSFCARVIDYPEVASGKAILDDPDAVVIPVKALQLKVSYPLNDVLYIPVTTEDPRGFTRKELFRVIYETYENIFNFPKAHGVWGHKLDHLFLEGAYLESPGTVELAMGS